MKNILIFVAGAGIGSVVTWKLLEKKYKNIADEEIESVVETFKNRVKEIKKNNKVETKDNKQNKKIGEKPDIKTVAEELGYSSDDKKTETTVEYVKKPTESIMIISPEEYGLIEDYELRSLTYYNDDVLTDENDKPVLSTKEIGDALRHFGEYEDDAVYVRNDELKTDYEILRSEKDYNI